MTEKEPTTTNEDFSSPNLDLLNKKKRNKVFLKIFFVFLLLTILTTIYWYLFIRFHESTDDAYVNGNIVNLMSPEQGTITAIYADNTDFVKQGQLLIELDPTLYQLAFEQAQVELAVAVREVQQLYEAVQQKKAALELKQADLKRAQEDFESRNSLRNTEAISIEDLNHAQANLTVAQAATNLSKHELNSAIAAIGSTSLENHPNIQNKEIALKQAYVNLKRCKILAPVSGFISQRKIQVGEWVSTTRFLLSIIPLDQIWIDANFKETELRDIRIGQPVTVKSDMYGSSVLYHGKVLGVLAGTGSVFSLIPPQNATGNWIKIVQRIPVRISLDSNELKQFPLFLGLSTYVVVDTKNQLGDRLASKPVFNPILTTSVYEIPMQPVQELIDSIIQANLNHKS
ncbi:Multidrug export protein EmrA [Candidatus Protochlamydia amoebophila]|uniref:HlyD family efflux transporter periplasmic adaptor subunit n=1 Tax=Candidatus Protochlamydia amoebophila TaxID=362787 RepID=UPI001BC8D44B|nr:HlyD family efflux transporter periplasmic adaptor subunit [Candidatus Protochlamydia amoebophila]MBS4163331.1 Multidrug export protein EmrA [Candidatus Protochlamydia amoebophila]